MSNQKIIPFLWFDNQAAEAANFYVGIFPNSRIVSSHSLVTTFELEGVRHMAINGGPRFQHSEAFSLLIQCDNQQEIDHYWQSLIAGGGAPSMCGWLKDKYGVSWQVVPSNIGDWMTGPDQAAAQRGFQALMGMTKIVIADIEKAMQG
jgi:predicted 3-demethylubiquinone-9 3-methyltransferase (glyoxalase superfamily)